MFNMMVTCWWRIITGTVVWVVSHAFYHVFFSTYTYTPEIFLQPLKHDGQKTIILSFLATKVTFQGEANVKVSDACVYMYTYAIYYTCLIM